MVLFRYLYGFVHWLYGFVKFVYWFNIWFRTWLATVAIWFCFATCVYIVTGSRLETYVFINNVANYLRPEHTLIVVQNDLPVVDEALGDLAQKIGEELHSEAEQNAVSGNRPGFDLGSVLLSPAFLVRDAASAAWQSHVPESTYEKHAA